jgi:hypothetical protein
MTIKPTIVEQPPYTEYQGWKAWEDKFKPIKNHFSKDPDETMFETYGEEVEFIQKADNKYIWTYLQGDMSDLICAGYHYVNRLGYYISSIPWENEDDYVLLSVQKECECYDEETGEGKEDCLECEGYGMITEYVE